MADMSVIVEWVNNKIDYLDTLNNEIERKDELELIEIKLKSLTSLELDNVASNVNMSRLFTYLTSTTADDREFTHRVCNVLIVLFEVLNPTEIYQQYCGELTQHLPHHDSVVRKLMLNQLDRIAVAEHSQLLGNVDLLKMIIDRIADDDIGVANIAMKVAGKVGRDVNTTKLLCSGLLLRTIAKMVSKNNAVSFRVYEVIIDISKSSEECFRVFVNSGLIDSLINLLEDNDILLQLNALDALGDLATNNAGLNYLEQRGFLSDLEKKVSCASEDPLANLLIPGLMKFFGNIAKNHLNEIITKYPVIISAFFDIIDSADDMVILMNALDTLGHIASTPDGKYTLDNLRVAMPSAMKKIGTFINKMPTEVRLRALDSLALILHVDKDNNNNRIFELTKSWFDLLDTDSLSLIFKLCKQPFPDIKLSSMKVLLEIASQYWGQNYIANYPGILEFLMNRRTEIDCECKIVKYEIIKALSKADCFDSKTIELLEEYVRAGPLAIDINTEVATESGANT